MDLPAYDAVILAGGAARRLGGVDKATLDFGGRTSLDRVIAAVSDAEHVVVVGPARPTYTAVTWCREQPAGSGPVAALRTGLAVSGADRVVVLAADLPLVEADTVRRLLLAADRHDGAVLVDAEGHEQFLCAAYSGRRLAEALAPLPGGASMRRAVSGLDLARVPDTAVAGLDCDTWEQVEEVRRRL